jgi:hypothetical protein
MASDSSPIIVDAGGLVAVERRSATMQALVAEAALAQILLVIPAPVLAQVWRGGARQVLLARFLNLPFVEVDLLTRTSWQAAGVLCGAMGTSDVVDAAVIICARERGSRVVVTSDPDDLGQLDPALLLREP